MNDPIDVAASYGLTVSLEAFGAAAGVIAAEYDPRTATICINARLVQGRSDARELIAACVAHELYHHLEHLGCVTRHPCRRVREARADAYARRTFGPAVDPARVRLAIRRECAGTFEAMGSPRAKRSEASGER